MSATMKTTRMVNCIPVWGLCTAALFSIFFTAPAHSQDAKKLTPLREPYCEALPEVSQEQLYFRLGVYSTLLYIKGENSPESAALAEKVQAFVGALGIPRSIALNQKSEETVHSDAPELSSVEKSKLTAQRLAELRGKRAAGLYRLGNELMIHGIVYDEASKDLLVRMDETLVELMWEAEVPVEMAAKYRKELRDRKLNSGDFYDRVTAMIDQFEAWLTISPVQPSSQATASRK